MYIQLTEITKVRLYKNSGSSNKVKCTFAFMEV